MSKGFWENLPKPFFVLAPMADVTDLPFRSIIAKCGKPDVFYTEFVSAHGLASYGRERLMRDLAISKYDHPIVAQFFGTNPEYLFSAGKLAHELGFDGVDINMGCPDKSIVKQGAGIALAKNPKLAQELIIALKDGAKGLPVAVKTRLGISNPQEWDEWIPAILESRPDVLIIHGRTMKEMSKVPAHWDIIAKVAKIAHDSGILCVGNGDILSREQGIGASKLYGVDGIMIARGALQNPWIFSHDIEREHLPSERLNLLLEHIDLWIKQWDKIKSPNLMKKFFKIYCSGFSGSAILRARLMECESFSDIVLICNQILKKSI